MDRKEKMTAGLNQTVREMQQLLQSVSRQLTKEKQGVSCRMQKDEIVTWSCSASLQQWIWMWRLSSFTFPSGAWQRSPQSIMIGGRAPCSHPDCTAETTFRQQSCHYYTQAPPPSQTQSSHLYCGRPSADSGRGAGDSRLIVGHRGGRQRLLLCSKLVTKLLHSSHIPPVLRHHKLISLQTSCII